MLKYSFSDIVDNREVNGPTAHMSVTVKDIETKLFKNSDDRIVLRPEHMKNVMFHGSSMVYSTCNSMEFHVFAQNSTEYFTWNPMESPCLAHTEFHGV